MGSTVLATCYYCRWKKKWKMAEISTVRVTIPDKWVAGMAIVAIWTWTIPSDTCSQIDGSQSR